MEMYCISNKTAASKERGFWAEDAIQVQKFLNVMSAAIFVYVIPAFRAVLLWGGEESC